jgi:hypothetical protein
MMTFTSNNFAAYLHLHYKAHHSAQELDLGQQWLTSSDPTYHVKLTKAKK